MDDSTPETGPFFALYEEWMRNREEPKLTARLEHAYRDAWRADIGSDRYFIIYFIGLAEHQPGADLIVEGLSSTKRSVAEAAGTWAAVADARGIDFGPELRPAYRAFVRRCPDYDTLRPSELYGHQAGDENDGGARPFLYLYEEWCAADYPGDAHLLQQLVGSYRAAWTGGDAVERSFVLLFAQIMMTAEKHTQVVHALDLIIEGLQSDDLTLSITASSVASFLLHSGFALGAELRAAIETHCERLGPDHRSSRNLTYELKKRDGLIPP